MDGAGDGAVHVILGNYATHKHAKVCVWLERRSRWTFHLTPTSSSWLNAGEGICTKQSTPAEERLFYSDIELLAAINSFLAEPDTTGFRRWL